MRGAAPGFTRGPRNPGDSHGLARAGALTVRHICEVVDSRAHSNTFAELGTMADVDAFARP